MNHSRLNGRVAKLEQAQDEDHTEPEITVHIRFSGKDDPPLPPGSRVLHIELDGRPSWWEVIGEGDDA